jgi:activator of 2-hydroxyglutaryl-CoA dehydratase
MSLSILGGLVKSIEERLERRLLVPEEPQIVAALGALIAGEKVPH